MCDYACLYFQLYVLICNYIKYNDTITQGVPTEDELK